MRNPFQTEADAYRMVWLTIVAFALIAAGAAIDRWLGLAVFVAEALVFVWWITTRGRAKPPEAQTPRPHPGNERRILVLANETVGGPELLSVLRRRAGGVSARVLVISPALNSPLRHWVSDEDAAREEAQQRLSRSLRAMRDAGIEATGEVGDSDPLQAIADALRTFAPDELVISTHPPGRSNWLERDLPTTISERFALPTTHVVVDLDGEPAQPAEPAETAEAATAHSS